MELEQKLISGTGNVDAGNTTLLVVAATIFSHEGNYEAALRFVDQSFYSRLNQAHTARI
jgi:hypothetical protein